MFINNNYLIKLKNIRKPLNVSWNKSQLDMVDEIIKSYDVKKGYIKISSDNKLLDGNHRYLILLNHYGGEHEIIVKQIGLKRIYLNLIMFILLPITLAIAIVLHLLVYIKRLFVERVIFF